MPQNVAIEAQRYMPRVARHLPAADPMQFLVRWRFTHRRQSGRNSNMVAIQLFHQYGTRLANLVERFPDVVGGQAIEQRRYVVATLEKKSDQVLVDGDAAGPNLFQQTLHRVRKLDNSVETEYPR